MAVSYDKSFAPTEKLCCIHHATFWVQLQIKVWHARTSTSTVDGRSLSEPKRHNVVMSFANPSLSSRNKLNLGIIADGLDQDTHPLFAAQNN